MFLYQGTANDPRFFPPRAPPLPPLPEVLLFGPSISKISFLLNFSVPPENLPTPGAPTPLSRFPSLPFFAPIFAFSRMIPFSLACCRRVLSRSFCLDIMPCRCDVGILSCLNIDTFEPNACNRISVALCLLFPWSVGFVDDSRRCDSLSRR